MKVFYVYGLNTKRKLTVALTMKKAYALAQLLTLRGFQVTVGN